MLCTLTPGKMSAMSYDPLTHSRHNAGDRNVKVGHVLAGVSGTTNRNSPSTGTCRNQNEYHLRRHNSKCKQIVSKPSFFCYRLLFECFPPYCIDSLY